MEALLSTVLDSIHEQLAVLDGAGNIVYCNQAWIDFGGRNGMPPGHDWIGKNYLGACEASAAHGDADSDEVRSGMLDVIKGDLSFFSHEYPCHSPIKKRWFEMRFSPLREDANHFVVVHHDITARKLSEERIAELNIELRELSLTDSLTRLANRMLLDAALSEEIQRAERYGKPVSVILFDIDYFKKINDTRGHLGGDAALVRVAKIIGETCRRSDIAGRWGGDEFLIILPETVIEAAATDAEKLRSAICGGQSADAYTCSFGVAAYKAGDTPDLLIGRVDAALYEAKEHGRNRVEVVS
jgi:diguanylate cyclase (GGDEF)-like protein